MSILQTPLYACHLEAHARMVDFAGWQMPINYGSQIEEHHAVRRKAGLFDISHMLGVDIQGADATRLLRLLLTNDVIKLKAPGKALYSCMLNEEGGILDDLIVYRFDDQNYRAVVNAATAESDLAWITQQARQLDCKVQITPLRQLAMLALQGPQAIASLVALPEFSNLAVPAPFSATLLENGIFIGRTGYTGEDGVEIALPAQQVPALWHALLAAGVVPAGLGARDTLRLEAGMNLYGQDMDEHTLPMDCGLAWTVDLKDAQRQFIGRRALENTPQKWQMLGLVLDDKGVLRAHMTVQAPEGDGMITSGSFSPTLQQSIALARMPTGCEPGQTVTVEVRGKPLRAHLVRPPFVRQGKILV